MKLWRSEVLSASLCANRLISVSYTHLLTDQVQYNRTDPEVDKQIKLRLEGESYFLRAWWHFELLKMYGGKAKNGKALGIPLADHFISQDEAAQNGEFLRPTYQATVDFIVNDLDNAIELLPNVYQGDDLEFGNTQIGRAKMCIRDRPESALFVWSSW